TSKDNQPCTKCDLKDLGTFEVWGFGSHMATNASLAILAASNELDIAPIRKNLVNYRGTKERSDIDQAHAKFVVIAD
ncbi:UDP-N-acetylmuramate--L-alanine ligase, partial [Aliarcobacter butzleri]